MLSDEIIKIIIDNQVLASKEKQLTPALLSLAYDQKWFKLWVPNSFGGLGMDLKSGCELLENLAYVDGAFAWTVTLCSGATMFVGYIDPEIAGQIFSDRQICFGGSGQVSGKADLVGGYYQVSGEWKYATGAPHLTHFTMNCAIFEDGKPLFTNDGNAVVKSFFVDRDDVMIHYDWDTFGLACTASHSFTVNKLMVHTNRSFVLDPKHKTIHNTLFDYPFKPFAELTLLVNYMGMFQRFLDLVQKYLFEKSKESNWSDDKIKSYFRQHDEIEQAFKNKRHRIYDIIPITYDRVQEGLENESNYEEIAVLSRNIVDAIKHDTVILFSMCGIEAAQSHSKINMVFRNLFTAIQHSLLGQMN